ncbi:MAG: HD domain-containing protein [Bacteroidota bacterium]
MDFRSPDFNLSNSDFDHASRLHGVMHTYRVMCHVLVLGKLEQLGRTAILSFCAAYIHDLSRRHDGICLKHGPRAASEKLPLYEEMFVRHGIRKEEIVGIAQAVAAHSQKNEVPADNVWYKECILLKDADALDRLRLGSYRLDPKYLRLQKSHTLLDFAQDLLDTTKEVKILKFSEVLDIAEMKLGFSISQ